jgi:hypothetical protein
MANLNVTTQLQRKYSYSILFNFGIGREVNFNFSGDEFTPSEIKHDIVTMQTPKGPITQPGLISYGQFTIKKSFEIESGTLPAIASLISWVEDLSNHDTNTFDMIVTMQMNLGSNNLVTTYKQEYQNCSLINLKYDGLNNRGSDDAVHVDITCQPGRVKRINVDGATIA